VDVRWWKLPEPLRFVCFWAAGLPAWVTVVLLLWVLFEIRQPWWRVLLYSTAGVAVGIGLFALVFRVASLMVLSPATARRHNKGKE